MSPNPYLEYDEPPARATRGNERMKIIKTILIRDEFIVKGCVNV
jgi:hypothetical protein